MILACSVAYSAEVVLPNTLSPEEAAEGFQLLFDGKTVSPEIWKGDIKGYPVEDGEMVCRGRDLTTVKKYADFELRFEFKLPAGGNNGVRVRGSTEIQILDHSDSRYRNLQPYQFNGSIYYSVGSKRSAEKNDFLKPIGQWNDKRIIIKGTKYKVILNGETIIDTDVSELKDKKSLDGRVHNELQRLDGEIGFLGHGDPVKFRNIRVKEFKKE
jgi:hypothetical protein